MSAECLGARLSYVVIVFPLATSMDLSPLGLKELAAQKALDQPWIDLSEINCACRADSQHISRSKEGSKCSIGATGRY